MRNLYIYKKNTKFKIETKILDACNVDTLQISKHPFLTDTKEISYKQAETQSLLSLAAGSAADSTHLPHLPRSLLRVSKVSLDCFTLVVQLGPQVNVNRTYNTY